MQYSYLIRGTTPEEESWEWEGTQELRSVDDFLPMVQRIISDTFAKISTGDAAGSPGTTILGPYQVVELILSVVV
jgi:hypothetical protein